MILRMMLQTTIAVCCLFFSHTRKGQGERKVSDELFRFDDMIGQIEVQVMFEDVQFHHFRVHNGQGLEPSVFQHLEECVWGV